MIRKNYRLVPAVLANDDHVGNLKKRAASTEPHSERLIGRQQGAGLFERVGELQADLFNARICIARDIGHNVDTILVLRINVGKLIELCVQRAL